MRHCDPDRRALHEYALRFASATPMVQVVDATFSLSESLSVHASTLRELIVFQ